MTTVADFIKLPKKDSHNNLDLGMRYSSYVTWAGFYVPDFPEDGSFVKKELRAQVKDYTILRTASESDVQKLMALSLTEAIADNVQELYGTINYDLLDVCKTPEVFIALIENVKKKYAGQIKLKPILSIDTDNIKENTMETAAYLLTSNVFSDVYLYGKNLLSMPQKFTAFIKMAKEKGINSEIDVACAKSSDEFKKLLLSFVPAVIINGEKAARDKDILNFMNKNSISTVVTPNPDTANGNSTMQKKAEYIRIMKEAGSKVTLASESMLIFNQSISQFASALCNTDLFSKEEVETLIN
ncbi:amidohydrolase family protein [Treponema pectinovorum]|uniref:hypothetical protein n=1 Tax=Treponema pectinovorum TaxID=164 RepID=UPI0011C93E31|nr:hypothetical protein [Treponema pectinovorum]